MSSLPEPIAFSEEEWVRALIDQEPHPNLLVVCDGPTPTAVARRVADLCPVPCEHCLVPGELRLPECRPGTLVLHDVAALTLEQQLALFDWLTGCWHGMQVISIASTPLLPLVHSGRFLEGLYYRLNVVYLVAGHRNRKAMPAS